MSLPLTISELAKFEENEALMALINGDSDETVLVEYVNRIDSEIAAMDEFKEIEIPEYREMLEKLGMTEDIPEEGLIIEHVPNFNGTLYMLMLTCAHTQK